MSTSASSTKLKIAAIQMVSSASLQQNLVTAERLIKAAAADGAQLAVLPEYFCMMGLKDTDKVHAKEKLGSGPIQEKLAAITKDSGIYLIAGTIPLEAKDPNKVLNTTLIFGPDGQRVGRYDKIHLFGFQTSTERYQESETIEAGEQPGIVKISINGADWTLGLSICYDLRFPELYRALGQVDCHIIPAAFTYTTGKDHWEVLLRARAIDSLVWVGAAAQAGTHENGRRTWGHSMWVDPWGQVVACQPQGAACVVAELDMQTLLDRRQQLPAVLPAAG